MIFKDLTNEEKQDLHNELIEKSINIGGKNFFLQMIEDIKGEKQHPLLNKSGTYHFSKGVISWNKTIYQDTLTALFNGMKKEELDGDIINGLKPKEYKKCMNMLRALKPLTIKVVPKDENSKGFVFNILDASIKGNTKVSLLFKIIFFYNVDFSKKVFNYE